MMNIRQIKKLYIFSKQVLTNREQGCNMNKTSHEENFTRSKLHVGEVRKTMKNKIKEMRTLSKITQQQLAEMVHVSSRTIISIEKGQYNPSLMLAYRIAQVFNVSVEELCCLKENKEMEDKQYEDI